MTTTLTQASQRWISRPADERFLSLIEMQAFKSRIRDNSATKIISSRSLQLQPSGESAHALQIIGPNGEPAASTHWSFGQLCSLASPGNSPASYFRETHMPAPVIADCLNFNWRFTLFGADKVADVLNAAVIAYHASAVELAALWQDRKIPMIWAEIAGELDIAAWKIGKIIRERLDPRRSPNRKK